MTSLPSPSPGLDAQIDAALSELDGSALEAKVHNDPLQLPFAALASFLRAQRQLHADTILSMQRSIEVAKQPVQDDDLRRAVVQGISAHARNAVRAANWRNVLIAAGIFVATLVVGAGCGYWIHGDAPTFAGIRAGIDRCDDKPDGSQICWIPIWTKPPPAKTK